MNYLKKTIFTLGSLMLIIALSISTQSSTGDSETKTDEGFADTKGGKGHVLQDAVQNYGNEHGGLSEVQFFGQRPSPFKDRDKYLKAAQSFAETIQEHGKDTYGEKKTNLILASMNANKLTHREWGKPNAGFRAGGEPRASSMIFDTGLLRLLFGLSDQEHGQEYTQTGHRYIKDFFDNAYVIKGADNVWAPAFGEHAWYDVLRDRTAFTYHEFKWTHPPWSAFMEVRPERTKDLAYLLRRHITQFEPPHSSRHWNPDKDYGRFSMPTSIGYWISGWAKMYRMTKKEKYLEWINEQLNYIWNHRGEAGLFGSPLTSPRQNRTMYSTPWGTYAIGLLKASLILEDHPVGRKCRKHALHFQTTFLNYAELNNKGVHYWSFDIDTGEPKKSRVSGWDEQSIRTLAGLAYGYRISGNTRLKEALDRKLNSFGLNSFHVSEERVVNSSIPINTISGDVYHVLTALLNLYLGSEEKTYLNRARALADYALSNHRKNRLFVQHSDRYARKHEKSRRIYSNRYGGDDLAYALFRLHLALKRELDVKKYYADPLVAY